MIDPKELRIGNTIYHDGKAVSVFSMSMVDGKMVIVYTFNDTDSRTYYEFPSEFDPILLTSEWLERFGFNKRDDGGSIDWWRGIGKITSDWWVKITEIKDSNYFFYRSGDHPIKYVHQLQNLYFALTGEEL